MALESQKMIVTERESIYGCRIALRDGGGKVKRVSETPSDLAIHNPGGSVQAKLELCAADASAAISTCDMSNLAR